jgi:hypothetical protein
MYRTRAAEPIRVFISYRHASHQVLNEVREHLGWLENSNQIKVFDDREIDPGDDWDQRIMRELDQSHIIIFLINAKFMSSAYCTKVELRRAIERREKEGTRIIPLITEDCDWEGMPTSKIAALPKDKANNLKPLKQWRGNKDSALAQLARHLREIVERLALNSIILSHSGVVYGPSIGYGEKAIIKFINRTGDELLLFWSNYGGDLEQWGLIDKGNEFTQKTWIGHVWVLKGRSGGEATYKAVYEDAEIFVDKPS